VRHHPAAHRAGRLLHGRRRRRHAAAHRLHPRLRRLPAGRQEARADARARRRHAHARRLVRAPHARAPGQLGRGHLERDAPGADTITHRSPRGSSLKPVIVHGPVSDAGDHAFLPEDLALEALEAWSAYNHARTWREFWQKLPELHRSMLGYPHSTKPEYEGELPRYPDDDTPFDKLLAAGDEGEFPRYAHVQEEAWQWMPEDIRERYG